VKRPMKVQQRSNRSNIQGSLNKTILPFDLEVSLKSCLIKYEEGLYSQIE